MNKKLLAAAIGVALAGSMAGAVADVTLYGNVNVSIDSVDADGGRDDINMSSNTSALGVKGSEDLGNGLMAIFKAEYEFDAADAGGLTGRDQWVGLQGGFGQTRFGSIGTSYESHGAMIDPLYRTSLQGRSHGLQSTLHSNTSGTSGRDGRMTHHLRYDSPDVNVMNGALTGTVDYSFDDDETNGDDDAYGVGAQFKSGPALVFADWITSDRGGDDSAWKLGGSWEFGQVAVYGQYEGDNGLISSDTPGNAVDSGDVWHLGGSLTMGNTLMYLAFGQGADNESGGAKSGEYTAWTIGADHHLSNRTDAYAGFNQVDCDEGDGTLLVSSHPCDATGAAGGEIDTFSVGLRHKF